MRSLVFVLIATCAAIAHPATAAAGPFELDPPSVITVGWQHDEGRKFRLEQTSTGYAFSVEGLGRSEYDSLAACCTDVFGRVRDLYPGASLRFSQLAFNTLPLNTVFMDNLNFDLLHGTDLRNLVTFTGLVTLELPPDMVRTRPTLTFAASSVRVPEPGTLLLLGGGLLGLARVVGRRQRRR